MAKPMKRMSAVVVALAVLATSCTPQRVNRDLPASTVASVNTRGVVATDLDELQLKALVNSNQIVFVKGPDNDFQPVCRCGHTVLLHEISPFVKKALIATEDKRFMYHKGVDPYAVMRAIFHSLNAPRWQGGSTLTQQLIKNMVLNSNRDEDRKKREMALALSLERVTAKSEILLAYLNRMVWGYHRGRMIVGVDQAARFYFGRTALELSLYESAVLVGMLKAPSRYSPNKNPELARQRAKTVLALMVENGDISKRDMDRALARDRSRGPAEPVWVETTNFTNWVLSEIRDVDPGFSPGLETRIPITLQVMPQHRAEAALKKAMSGSRFDGAEAGYLAMSFDGRVLVMVGQRDFDRHNFNFAVQAKRQPASTFKPIVFAAALQAGVIAADKYATSKLAVSDNQFARDVFDSVGAKAVIKMARELGISSRLLAVQSLALGTSEVSLLEMVRSYVPFANAGKGTRPTGYLGIISSGRSVMVRAPVSKEAISSRVARAMKKMLGAVVSDRSGTGNAAARVPGAFGKTGTSSFNRDAWFIGSTARRVSGIWIGRPDARSMNSNVDGHVAADVWADIETVLTK